MTYKDGGLRPLFHEHLRAGIHWQSIETAITGSGVPDDNYCGHGREGWIEYKVTDGNKVKIRPMQVAWHERRMRAGGRTFLAVRKINSLYLYRGEVIRRVFLHGLSGTKPLLLCDGGPPRWDWGCIRKFLLA